MGDHGGLAIKGWAMAEKGDDREGLRAATLYVAIELSRSGWLAAVLARGAQRPSRHQLKAGNAAQLLALIARRRGTATRVCTCYEDGVIPAPYRFR